jgi:hypothetical protein
VSGRIGAAPTPQARPAALQSLFIWLYAGLWILGWVVVPEVGRPEKFAVAIGLLAIPVAAGYRLMMPATAAVGVAGLLGSYVLSSLINGLTPHGIEFILSLAARALFLWVCYALLQNKMVIGRAMWLLIVSSVISAVVADYVMARFGIGVGRLDPIGLEYYLLDPFTFSTFASAQLAPIGAILLFGAARAMPKQAWRIAGGVAAFLICLTAYGGYVRREHLISIPLVLLVLAFGGERKARQKMRFALIAAVGFIGVAAWDYMREDSLIGLRIESEFAGGFVDPAETRLTSFYGQVAAIAANPIFGYGAGEHAAAISPYVPAEERFLSGFNTLGWLAVEGGLPCALFYLIMLLGVWRAVWRWRSLPGSEPFAVVLRCGPALVLQVLLWGVFGNAWDLPLGWFVLGMILAAVRIAEHTVGAQAAPFAWRAGPAIQQRRAPVLAAVAPRQAKR